MAVIDVKPGPGDALRGQHLHYGDAINLIVTGSVCMDGTWLRPGHAKIAPAGLTYGDAIPAPEGYTFLEIFESHPGAKPCYSNPRHQRYFEEVHGEVYAGVFGYLRSEEHTSELQSLMRISYDVFCLQKKTIKQTNNT